MKPIKLTKTETIPFDKLTEREKQVVYHFEINSIEKRFYDLAKKWKRETGMSSIAFDKITNSNYLEIIGLGTIYKDAILKLIFNDLTKGEEFWHYALKSISGENPVPKGMTNNLSVVRESWLKWAIENNKL